MPICNDCHREMKHCICGAAQEQKEEQKENRDDRVIAGDLFIHTRTKNEYAVLLTPLDGDTQVHIIKRGK